MCLAVQQKLLTFDSVFASFKKKNVLLLQVDKHTQVIGFLSHVSALFFLDFLSR